MISKHKHSNAAGKWLALAVLFGLGTMASIDAVAQEAKVPKAAKKTDPNRYLKKVTLPHGNGMVVVSEGDFEPRSLGSYSVRLYGAENLEFPFDDFLSGCIRPRPNGGIEKLLVRDIDGDGYKDVVVIIHSVGNGGFLSAEAFGFREKQVKLIALVEDLEWNADVTKALRLKRLNDAKPGSAEWLGAVEAFVQVSDDEGHGPDLGSAEWMNAVDRKVFGDAADKSVKIGSPEWLAAIGKALPSYKGAKAAPAGVAGTLSLEGYGEIHFGDTMPTVLEKLKKLKATAHDMDDKPIDAKWWAKAKADQEKEVCAILITMSCYPGVTFMVEEEKIVRADIAVADIPCQLKIEVGMTVDQVKTLCPNAKFELDKYAEDGEDLKNAFIPSPDGKGGWRITEKDGEIIQIRAGLKPAIEMAENG